MADHDAGQRQPRADAMHQQIAGHFKQEVAEEKHPRAEAVDGVGELEINGHRELGETHVHPVKVGRHIAQKQKRDQATRDPGVDPVFVQPGRSGSCRHV